MFVDKKIIAHAIAFVNKKLTKNIKNFTNVHWRPKRETPL